MALLAWHKDFTIGVPSVDYEHQGLIRLINELHANLVRQTSEYTVSDFLGEIHAKIAAHFALEEKIMRERRYDEFEDHKTDHERLLDEIRDIMDEYEEHMDFDEQIFAEKLNSRHSAHERSS